MTSVFLHKHYVMYDFVYTRWSCGMCVTHSMPLMPEWIMCTFVITFIQNNTFYFCGKVVHVLRFHKK